MTRKKTQIIYIPGGETFKSRKDYLRFLRSRKVSFIKKDNWAGRYLDEKLGKNFQIIRPRMPLRENARYGEWVIHFNRYLPLLKNNSILIGQSLGGIFLAKYLSEKKFPKKILATFLVCPPFDNSLPLEDLVGGFKLKSDLSLIEKNSKKLYLMFAKNDPIVPFSHAKKYAEKLKNAKIIVYKHIKGHFQVSKFPEIVAIIKKGIPLQEEIKYVGF